jgi:hypothetical protein
VVAIQENKLQHADNFIAIRNGSGTLAGSKKKIQILLNKIW